MAQISFIIIFLNQNVDQHLLPPPDILINQNKENIKESTRPKPLKKH